MKGDYTREAEITCSTKGQHYPQMKGDYTIGFTSSIVFDGQHYPQIKGDYTQVWILPFKGSSPPLCSSSLRNISAICIGGIQGFAKFCKDG